MNIQDTYINSILFSGIKECCQIEIQENESFLFHYSFNNQFDNNLWSNYLSLLPQEFQNEVLRYRRWQDRYNCLIGKLLVYAGYYAFCGDTLKFDRFRKDAYGKPYIMDSDFYFNISHSGNKVVCIFSKYAIGIDIEEITDIESTLFENVFSDKEMQKITEVGVSKFYEYWTKKEAIIKAIGKGMSIPLLDIKVENNHTRYKDDIWYTKSYRMDKVHCSIATQSEENNVNLIEIKF